MKKSLLAALLPALFPLSLALADGPAPRAGKKASSPDLLGRTTQMVSAFQAGRWEECAKAARAVAEEDPSSFLPAYYLAAASSHLKDERQGVEWLNRALETDGPQLKNLKNDPHLAWLLGRKAGAEALKWREDRLQARLEGVLLHQRFGFRLPLWDNPKQMLSTAELRGKPVAVLLIARHEDEGSITAAMAIQAVSEELGMQNLETVALHLEPASSADLRSFLIESFRKEANWKGQSVLGERSDLFPLEVTRFPAVVFLDAATTPRFIEEGYRENQAARYRERATLLVEEARKAAKASAKPGAPAAQKGGR
jgi:hypothetical protein